MSEQAHQGSCLCGAIQFEVEEILPLMAHCHCSMCRKFHGAAYATFGEAPIDKFHWLQGQDKLACYKAENGTSRQFCSQCGSSLTFSPANDSGRFIEFALATLDTHPDVKPDAHIYTDNKAHWSCINDGLPQYKQGRE